MLARRIIPVVLYRGHQAVKGVAFNSWRSVGNVRQAVRVYQARQVDELILLDISGNSPDVCLVSNLCSEMFMPVTVGGGVKTIDQFRQLIANGADKVAINTAAVVKPDLITEAAQKFGRQAVVVSIDARNGTAWTRSGTHDTGISPVDLARQCERLGAGEILVNAIDRDGTLSGYDIDLVGSVAGAVSIPVVACGGAGSYGDMKAAFAAGAHAVAASAMFCFTDATPAGAAEYLHRSGVSVRRRAA